MGNSVSRDGAPRRGSEALPVVRLTELFRQAAQNPIVTAAHRVNAG